MSYEMLWSTSWVTRYDCRRSRVSMLLFFVEIQVWHKHFCMRWTETKLRAYFVLGDLVLFMLFAMRQTHHGRTFKAWIWCDILQGCIHRSQINTFLKVHLNLSVTDQQHYFLPLCHCQFHQIRLELGKGLTANLTCVHMHDQDIEPLKKGLVVWAVLKFLPQNACNSSFLLSSRRSTDFELISKKMVFWSFWFLRFQFADPS